MRQSCRRPSHCATPLSATAISAYCRGGSRTARWVSWGGRDLVCPIRIPPNRNRREPGSWKGFIDRAAPRVHGRQRPSHCATPHGYTNWFSRGTLASCRMANTRSPPDHSPLRGSRLSASAGQAGRSRAGSLSLSKGRRRLMRWGNVNFSRNRPPLGQHFRLFDHGLCGLRLLVRRVSVFA